MRLAEPPVAALAPRDVAAVADAACSEHGLHLAIRYATPPPPIGTPMQRLIERAITRPHAGWLLRLGDLELSFTEGGRLGGLSLYDNFGVAPDTTIGPAPPASPGWLAFPALDGLDEEIVSADAVIGVTLDRGARRLRLTLGGAPPGAWHALANGLLVGLDHGSRVAAFLVDGFVWGSAAPV